MHTMWKGAISFGLVHVPVKMHSAVEEKDISMKQIHQECGANISTMRHCTNCKREVAWDEVVKGFEYEQGKFVQFSKEELDNILPEADKEIKILDFVNAEEIDPIYYQKAYYLSPGDTGSKAYSLLLHAVKTTNKVAVCKVVIRAKQSLGILRSMGDCFVFETIYFSDEVRSVKLVPNLPEHLKFDEKELRLALKLIQQLSIPFEATKYRDDYRISLIDAIEKKIQGKEIHIQPIAKAGNVLDLMAALQASLELFNKVNEAPPKQKRKKKLKQVVEETA